MMRAGESVYSETNRPDCARDIRRRQYVRRCKASQMADGLPSFTHHARRSDRIGIRSQKRDAPAIHIMQLRNQRRIAVQRLTNPLILTIAAIGAIRLTSIVASAGDVLERMYGTDGSDA